MPENARTPRPSTDREFKSSLWLASIQVSRVLVGLVVGVIVVRYLGPEDYGKLALALSLSGFFAAFSKLGLPRVLLKELLAFEASERELLASALLIQVLSSLVGILGTIMICFALGQPPIITVMAVLFSLAFIFDGSILFQQLFLAHHRLSRGALANFWGLGLSLVFRALAVVAAASVAWFAVANLVQNLAILIASLILVQPLLQNAAGRFRPRRDTVLRLIRTCLPFFSSTFLLGIPLYLDRVIIGELLTFADVAIFAVVLQLISIPSMFISSFVSGATPRLIPRLSDLTTGPGDPEIVQTLSIAVGLALVLYLGAALFAAPLMPLIYGPGFETSVWFFVAMGAGAICNVPSSLRWEFLMVQKKQNLTVKIALLHLFVVLGLQIALISQFGLLGATLAYGLQYAIFGLLYTLVLRDLAPFRSTYLQSLARGITTKPLIDYIAQRIAQKRNSTP